MNAAARDSDMLFAQAIEIASPEERVLFLENACANDAELRRELQKLVRDYFRAGEFLERPAAPIAAVIGASVEVPGAVVGSYTLVEQIGEGGMGLVFRAEQERPVRRRVALKVLKPGMDTKQVVARFEAERQALALMDHPGIAKVHDAGTTPAGRPYFVMELVNGVPVTDYCDAHNLPVRDRLELFVSVCRAVQHAHQKGVIHRDLKPTNVLVTEVDGRPAPKVIDFGIAKAAEGTPADRTQLTQHAQLVGTPLYMAPEQAEPGAADVDTRADVYSLGVVLYELLTGTTPFDPDALRKAGFDGMRQMIREQEPARPSARLSTLAAAARSTVSGRRGADDRPLARQLRGELDWVVMRCLEKDRNRRYDSAGALAADVERYLADEPVEARPPSWWYRVRKTARRNQAALATAGVVAAALVAATAVSTWQAVQARAAQKQAEADRDRAETAEGRAATEAAIAKAVSDFLQDDLLRLVDTNVQRGEGVAEDPDLTVKAALDRAAGTIGGRFQDQPLVEAAIRRTIGLGYFSLGENRRAVPHLERAFELHKAHLNGDHPETRETASKLALVYQWSGRRPEAIVLFEQILERRKATLGPDHVETLKSMDALAAALELDGQWPRARLLYGQVLEKRQASLGPSNPATLASIDALAWTDAMLGRLDEAFDRYEKLQRLYEAIHGPEFAASHFAQNYALVLERAGRLEEADRLLRQRLEWWRRRGGSGLGMHLTLDNLGHTLLVQKDYARAEPLLRESLAIFEKYRPDLWGRFRVMSLLGGALLGQQKYAEAEPLLLQDCEGLLERKALIQAAWKYRLHESVEFLVRLYDETNQPENARVWREKLPAEKYPPR